MKNENPNPKLDETIIDLYLFLNKKIVKIFINKRKQKIQI